MSCAKALKVVAKAFTMWPCAVCYRCQRHCIYANYVRAWRDQLQVLTTVQAPKLIAEAVELSVLDGRKCPTSTKSLDNWRPKVTFCRLPDAKCRSHASNPWRARSLTFDVNEIGTPRTGDFENGFVSAVILTNLPRSISEQVANKWRPITA
jgi:hypothetical protein